MKSTILLAPLLAGMLLTGVLTAQVGAQNAELADIAAGINRESAGMFPKLKQSEVVGCYSDTASLARGDDIHHAALFKNCLWVHDLKRQGR
jgi:hypothetical protein